VRGGVRGPVRERGAHGNPPRAPNPRARPGDAHDPEQPAASVNRPARAGGLRAGGPRAGAMVTIVLIVTVAIGCAGSPQPDGTARTARTSAPTTMPITPGTHPRRAPFVPAALIAKGLGLRAGPVAVPLLLRIP